jgi:hypothetical protein
LLFWAGCESRAELEDGDRARFDALITIAFQHLRLGFSQDLDGWSEELQQVLQQGAGVREWWSNYSQMFPAEFRELVNERLDSLHAAQQATVIENPSK